MKKFYKNQQVFIKILDHSSCYGSLEKIGSMSNFLYSNGIFKFLININIEVGTKRVIIKILLKYIKWYNLNKDEKVN